MAECGCLFRKVCFVILSFAILTIPACDNAHAPIDASDLNYQQPFGLNWDTYDGERKRIGDNPQEECRSIIADFGALIPLEKVEYIVTACIQEKYAKIFRSSNLLPEAFRDGELGVFYRGEFQPVSFSYSYLHRVLPNDSSYNVARRRQHARKIRKQLTTLYGAPDAFGYFDQNSISGFKALSEEKNAPCEAWVRDDVAMLLCSQRVILVDGIEMSLSFTRLDRAPNGKMLQCEIDKTLHDKCEAFDDTLFPSLPPGNADFLEVLANWIGSDTLKNCRAANLETIEQRLMLSEVDEESLDVVLEAYSGDDLAWYAINYAQEDDDGISAQSREKVVLFLLNKAALQGSAIAMNEMGASLLYCYLHVQQDLKAALAWLKRAAEAGDAHAMKSLAFMNLSGMTDETSPREEAARLLDLCSSIEEETCSKELNALRKFTALLD